MNFGGDILGDSEFFDGQDSSEVLLSPHQKEYFSQKRPLKILWDLNKTGEDKFIVYFSLVVSYLEVRKLELRKIGTFSHVIT